MTSAHFRFQLLQRLSRLDAHDEEPPRCGATPLGRLSTVPLRYLVCIEPRSHGGKHRNLNGDVWGYAPTWIERVEERRR